MSHNSLSGFVKDFLLFRSNGIWVEDESDDDCPQESIKLEWSCLSCSDLDRTRLDEQDRKRIKGPNVIGTTHNDCLFAVPCALDYSSQHPFCEVSDEHHRAGLHG
jgi:hypothetical protein